MDSTALIAHVPESVFPVVSGCVAFGTTLALSTLAQKMVGISTGTKIVPTVAGMATVALASLASQQMAVYNHQYMQSEYYNPSKRSPFHPQRRQPLLVATSASGRRDYLEVASFKIPLHELRVCVLGLITFRLLGGRFWGVAPSSITQVGSFSRWSIPCGESYANPAQRTMIERMGAKWGCHTCGSRMRSYNGPFKFVGDHMPPKSVAEQMNATWIRKYLLGKVPFRFYPQCVDCSNAQGSILSKAQLSTSRLLPSFRRAAELSKSGGGRTAHFHGLRPRINHLTGGVLAGITVVGATDRQIQTGHRDRFQDVHRRVEGWIRDVEKKLIKNSR